MLRMGERENIRGRAFGDDLFLADDSDSLDSSLGQDPGGAGEDANGNPLAGADIFSDWDAANDIDLSMIGAEGAAGGDDGVASGGNNPNVAANSDAGQQGGGGNNTASMGSDTMADMMFVLTGLPAAPAAPPPV
jgi:hypothetical protein